MRDMPTIFNCMKLDVRQSGAKCSAVLKGYSGIIPSPKQQNILVHFTKLRINLDERSQHVVAKRRKHRAPKTLVLHLNLIFRFEMFDELGIEKVFRSALDQRVVSDQTENCFRNERNLLQDVDYRRKREGFCPNRIDQDKFIHLLGVTDRKR